MQAIRDVFWSSSFYGYLATSGKWSQLVFALLHHRGNIPNQLLVADPAGCARTKLATTMPSPVRGGRRRSILADTAAITLSPLR
jgi:hypothetical protein